jgi:hypothetical protein
MEKYLCKKCMQNEYETQRDTNSEFPVFTIIGGVLGISLSFLTGMYVLIPLTVIAGIGTDLVCERCGSNEDVHQVMDSEVDEYGRVYSPLDSKEGGEDDFWDLESNTSPKIRYRYNDVEKKLVQENSEVLGKPDASQSDFDWSIPPESTSKHGMEAADSGNQNFGASGSGTGNGQAGLNTDMGGLSGSGARSANMSFSSGGGND